MPDTITSRAIAVLLVGLALLHASSIWVYRTGLNSEIDLTNEKHLAERLVTITRTIARLPSYERENTAHSLSGGPLEVHWSSVPLTVESQHRSGETAGLRRRLSESAPDLGAADLLVGTPSPASDKRDDPHLVLASLKLHDGSWSNFTITTLSDRQTSFLNTVIFASLAALGALGLSVIMLRTVTEPLRQCAAAARNFMLDAEPIRVAASGPRETRDLAAAFNELQRRVKRLVGDRTLMLAAISHDLKSPLTRVRLRVERVGDDQLRDQIQADMDELLEMIDAALAFLKSEESGEAARSVDLNAILESIRDEMTDLNHAASFESRDKIIVSGRHLELKRALRNLISNGAQYGNSVRIAATQDGAGVLITIDDDGPGIPDDEREVVFNPFHRLESSRNRATGGTGLGLTIARAIIRRHGGDVSLQVAPSGGLRAVVRLPSQPLLESPCNKKTSSRNSREMRVW